MSYPEEILKKYWGYDSFRPLQRDIINSVLSGNDTLALLPTGGGKSLCYQVPAMLLDGICIVVSPLISLMQDQVTRLEGLGVPAACIHSGMHYLMVRQTLANAVDGDYKMLYVSPERLQTRVFREYLEEMHVTMVAVDEAHCVSQWGHDFRPAYLQINSVRELFPRAVMLALTATATTDVRADIQLQLKMKRVNVFRNSFARDNIFYEVVRSEHKTADLLDRVKQECTIIYCRSRKLTELTAQDLIREGIPAEAYHAGLARKERDSAQAGWMTNKSPIMVATTAFGMGIDKPDVRMVMHNDAPENLESYFQEVGRGGRDGKPSAAVCLYNSGDIKRLRESTDIQFPPIDYLRQVYQSVAEYLQVPVSAQPDKYFPFDLTVFCHRFKLVPLNVLHALKLLEKEGLWTLTDAVYSPPVIQFIADRDTLDSLHQVNPRLGYVVTGLLRMYSGVFHSPVPIRETAIGIQLTMKNQEVAQALEQLAAMRILEYSRPKDGPQLFFHHYRVPSEHLTINARRIAALRKRHQERTDAMIAFLDNDTVCRENLLLRYFGERPPYACGHCDICRKNRRVHVDTAGQKAFISTTIARHGSISRRQLIQMFPPDQKESLIQLLRTMIDEGAVVMDGDTVQLPGR